MQRATTVRTGLTIVIGMLLGSYAFQANAIDSSQCGGSSILYHDDCGNRTEYYHVCLGPNGNAGTVNFTIDPGGTHALTVPKDSSITGSAPQCGGPIPPGCPAKYLVELGTCLAQPAPQSPAPTTSLQVTPRRLITQYTCEEAQKLSADLHAAAALNVDDRNQLNIVWSTCVAQLHNESPNASPQVVVVTPDQSASADNDNMFVKTLSLSDVDSINSTCKTITSATFKYL
jgi:hypothetical protein